MKADAACTTENFAFKIEDGDCECCTGSTTLSSDAYNLYQLSPSTVTGSGEEEELGTGSGEEEQAGAGSGEEESGAEQC